ncbi:MAG: hypothetical protein R3F59_33255 [Myxococcota bacterium]
MEAAHRVLALGLLVTGPLLVRSAEANKIDMSTVSSSGCDNQWYGNCLSNDVWGAAAVFGIDTPVSIPILTIGASNSHPSRITVAQHLVSEGNQGLKYVVLGRALSASTKVSMETRFFDSGGGIVATNVKLLHTGSSGMFSSSLYDEIPTGSISWKARLLVEGDAAAIQEAGALLLGRVGMGLQWRSR